MTEQLRVTAYVKRLLYLQKQPREAFHQKGVLRNSQNLHENNCTRFSILIKLQVSGLQLNKKETPALVISSEFYEISKNTYFAEQYWTTGSVLWEKNLPSYPQRPFNLSSYFKQTLQNKPLGKLFSNLTMNHGNSFLQLFIVARETRFCLMRTTF